MFRGFTLLVSSLLLLMGCHHQSSVVSSNAQSKVSQHQGAIQGKRVTQIRRLPVYNQVIVDGRINVTLHTGYRHPQILLQGDNRDLQQLVTRVENNTLMVSLGNGLPQYGPVSVDIQTSHLNSFTYHGVGNITGMNLNTRFLDLNIDTPGTTRLGGHINLHRLVVKGGGSMQINGVSGTDMTVVMQGKPRIQLVGVFNLSNLDLYGDGLLSGYWIKNDRLVIKEHGCVHVQLAGVANVMEVELWDQSDFNGRYLRAYRAFVKTHGHSVARLSAIRRQHTLASDASDIYFYNLPEMRTDFMAYNGAVLDMRDWNLYSTQEYTIYNK